MKAAIVGMGSIGRRHFDNLKTLGIKVIGLDINDPLNFDVDFALICVPTDNHLNMTTPYLCAGIPVFIEKPLAISIGDLETFQMIDHMAISMVACNLRFTSAMSLARGVLKNNGIESISARVSDSNIVREKYKESLALQDIHEFDYLSWLMGPIENIELLHNKDWSSYDAIVKFESGKQATVHGDKITQDYHRGMTIWTKKQAFSIPLDIDNQMYLNEMEYFANCVKAHTQPMNSIKEASVVTRKVIEAIRRSDSSGQAYFGPISSESPGKNWATVTNGSSDYTLSAS